MLGLDIVTATQPVTSKWSPESAIDLKGVNNGIFS